MLFPTVHLPRLFAEVPSDPAAAALYYSLLTGILWDVRENCVLLVDEGNSIGEEVGALVGRWPMRYRVRAKEQLKMLNKRHRLLEVPGPYAGDSDCASPGCRRALAVASREAPAMVLGGAGCGGCLGVTAVMPRVTDAAGYVLSEFARRRRKTSIVLAAGQWTRADFEREVLNPVFRYAKVVKIFDRNVGRLLIRWGGAHQADSVDRYVKENYRRTLDWVFGLFVRSSAARDGRLFEVTCALESRDESAVTEAVRVLRDFEQSLSVSHDFPLTIKVKRETGDAHMRHDRFLITDQVAVAVGRGFDLLTDDGLIRDTVISYVSNPGAIEREARDLPDAA